MTTLTLTNKEAAAVYAACSTTAEIFPMLPDSPTLQVVAVKIKQTPWTPDEKEELTDEHAK